MIIFPNTFSQWLWLYIVLNMVVCGLEHGWMMIVEQLFVSSQFYSMYHGTFYQTAHSCETPSFSNPNLVLKERAEIFPVFIALEQSRFLAVQASGNSVVKVLD